MSMIEKGSSMEILAIETRGEIWLDRTIFQCPGVNYEVWQGDVEWRYNYLSAKMTP